MSIVRVITSQSLWGQLVQNVMHFQNPDGALSALEIKDEVFTSLWTRLRNHQNTNLIYNSMSVQIVDSSGHSPDVFSLGGLHGSLDGDSYHPSIAVLFSIQTAFGGRHGHGRFYMCGLHFDFIEHGVIRPDIFALYQGDATFIANRFKSGGSGPLTLGVCPRSDPSDFKGMTDLIAKPTVGIQRRRNIGVGG